MTATGVGPDAEATRQPAPAGDGVRSGAPSAAPQPAEELGARDAAPRLLKVFSGIVAPTTLLTGLLFYFGRNRDVGYYRYFRVNITALDLTTNDYLLAGIDGLFVPIAVTSLLALVCLWLNRLLLTRLPADARRRAVRVLVPVAAVVGAVLMTLAFIDLFSDGAVFGANSAKGGLFLAVGVLLLTYAARLVRLAPLRPGAVPARRSATTGLAEWGAAFLLVSIGLFWAAGGYAFGAGTGGAIALHRALPLVPEAVIFSEQSLSLDVDGVTETRCADPDATYRFQYTGLRLVRMAGNQYVLLPATWSRETGTTGLLARSGGIRLEFRPAGPSAPGC